MSNDVERYNQLKLGETISKFYKGIYTRADVLEFFINARIDLTVKDKQKRENEKMKVSQAKEMAEKMSKL